MSSARLQSGLRAWLLVACTGFAVAAQAHSPYCDCKEIAEGQIRCSGGFSDGGDAVGVTLDVIGYDESILFHGQLGSDSSLTFARPAGEFYVLFDAGPGNVVEVDHLDIERR
ncbi:hypothetical protein ACIPL1_12050 [Pseudomonas sp. NPDC090202]|uniref:hypothetical protein n=1 Tax=unclassified Pseudomonas TaxID=196821 RepID=UPI0037FB843C